MSNYRQIYRSKILAFLRRFPPGTLMITRTLALDRAKPGFYHDPNRGVSTGLFRLWWEESLRAITKVENELAHE